MEIAWDTWWSEPAFWKLITIPFISAIVGWATNVLALKMTFYPLDFVGWKLLGWQGIIPSKAGVMAGTAVDLLTQKLLTIEERFDQIEPERVAEEIEPALNRMAVQIINETLEQEAPLLWESAPAMVKQRFYQRISEELPEVVEDIIQDIKTHITELFDLRAMVVAELENDRELLNQIFLKVGDSEFRFIERSGFYFGFLFGLIQMTLFGLASLIFKFPEAYSLWILPAAGLFVGWATNVIALKMIFEPLRPKQFGPWRVQGLFLKRQMEVAGAYAKMVAGRILTAQKIFETMLTGRASDRLLQLIQNHVKRAVDTTAGISKPLLQLTQGTTTYVGIKNKIAKRFLGELPFAMRYMFPYAEEALDIENSLRTKMQGLGPVDFVSFLRPIFQEDEWKLILVGAVLGFLAGLAQMILVFGGSL
ncbi:MAG: DUF445 domain-containing protein [Bacteroidota bacterium]